MNSCLSAGTSSTMKIELVGHTGTQAPQSMQPSGSTYNWVAASKGSSSFLGWMQSVGQASTQSSSLVQVSVMMYAMIAVSHLVLLRRPHRAAAMSGYVQCTNPSTMKAVTAVMTGCVPAHIA